MTLEASENPLVKRVFGMPPRNPNYVPRLSNAQIAAYLLFTFNGGETAYFGASFPIVSGIEIPYFVICIICSVVALLR